MRKPWNLRFFPLSNVRWVDIYSTFTICLFWTKWAQMSEGKDKEEWICSMRNKSAMRSGSRFKTAHCRYCYTEAFKIAHARTTCLCLNCSVRLNHAIFNSMQWIKVNTELLFYLLLLLLLLFIYLFIFFYIRCSFLLVFMQEPTFDWDTVRTLHSLLTRRVFTRWIRQAQNLTVGKFL